MFATADALGGVPVTFADVRFADLPAPAGYDRTPGPIQWSKYCSHIGLRQARFLREERWTSSLFLRLVKLSKPKPV
jgi:hypothetical protein